MAFTSQFTLAEILSLLGLAQSVYVLVYMLLRSGSIVNAVIPSLYFTSLALAFLFDAAAGRWAGEIAYYETWQWLFWFSGIPLGALLVLQIAHVAEPPKAKYFGMVLLIPLAFVPAWLTGELHMLYVAGLVIGAFSLLAIWLRRDLLDGLRKNPKFGRERFWLILALVSLNTAFLAATWAYLGEMLSYGDWIVIRNILGIAFVYTATTSLFRIYPQALQLGRKQTAGPALNSEEQAVIEKFRILLARDKIYQDAAYGRAELARELGIGEARLSRLVNVSYGKTIPQILNEYRVRDAQRLLTETDAAIQTVFEESGFNSITTFNRVFKELCGDSPTEFRARHRN
ncbi:MAG: AraC family transcriptional regulator [Micavibrio aeruginosavorus]|uniref:AraC family transcriptional regulator n=1 Tax=Micavibrio aeruginosavorus TaxID=349221 RepID=A0A2W5MU37_9BACT|nr:MAG: AraC family transcriptional regulator [Micavibrio aeruginosavorus]